MMEIRQILCPVDFSDTSRHALEHAVAIAGWYESRLTLLHVMGQPFVAQPPLLFADFAGPVLLESERKAFEDRLHLWLVDARAKGLSTETVLTEGRPERRILDRAASLPADLIVLGTHGRSGFEHLLLGSVAEKVLRQARCPVLTVPPMSAAGAVPYRRLLCPVDFSEPSMRALRFALSIAQESGAHLTVLHAFEWASDEAFLTEQFDTPDFRLRLETQVRGWVDRLVTDEARTWCEIETKLAYGKPYREILAAAASDRADLIVIGVHGRNALDLMLFGSTTNQVVRRASCPVLTLKH
jgi:nucleotide-binding universal stress UspA family protein